MTIAPLARAVTVAAAWLLAAAGLTVAADEPWPGFVTEEVEPGVQRILHDGVRDLSGATTTERPATYAEYLQTHVGRGIAAGADGSVWVFDGEGFFRLGAEETYDWSHQPRFFSDSEMEVTGEGTVWRLAPARTLRSFDGDAWTRYRQKQVFWALEAEPDGTVWATWTDSCGADPEGCVPSQVGRLGRRGWSVFDVPRTYAYSSHDFAVDATGEAWLCCRRNPAKHEDPGLLRLRDGRWRSARLPDIGATDGLVRFDASDDGTLWMRRSAETLERRRDGEWTVFSAPDGVPPLGYVEPRMQLVAAPDGSVWVTPSVSSGSPDDELKCDGVAHFDGTSWTRYLRDTCVFSMDVAPDGGLWLQGAKVEIENIDLYTLGEVVEPAQTFVIRPDGQGDLGNDVGTMPAPWGPLAVIDDPAVGGLDAAGGEGRVIISDRCVVLRAENGDRQTLIWRNGQTAWDPEGRQIVFQDPQLGKVGLAHRDRIGVGGAAVDEGPYAGSSEPTWLAQPDDSCPTGRWVVHQVELIEER